MSIGYDLINRVTQLLLGFAIATLIRFGLIRCCDTQGVGGGGTFVLLIYESLKMFRTSQRTKLIIIVNGNF